MTAKPTLKTKSKTSKKVKTTKPTNTVEVVVESSPVSIPKEVKEVTEVKEVKEVTEVTEVKEVKEVTEVKEATELEKTEGDNLLDQNTDELVDNFKTICTNLNDVLSNVKTLVSDVKKLEKRVNRDLKDARKNRKKSKQANGDKPKRAPSGFAKPSDISEELCVFLGRPFGTQMARTEVTKYVTQYIKEKGLQNPVNKRHILPDPKLGALLGAGKEEEVTYFNLQKYMKHHFPKSIPKSIETPVETPVS